MYTAEFSVTYEDNLDALKEITARTPSPVSTKGYLQAALISLGVVGVGVVMVWERFEEPLGVAVACMLILTGIGVGGLIRTLWMWQSYPAIMERTLAGVARQQRTGPLSITLAEDGISTETETARNWWSWREVASVDATERGLIVMLRNGSGLRIPRRALEGRFQAAVAFAVERRAMAPPMA